MPYRDEVLSDTPLVFIECNETTGLTLSDSSGNGHDADINGGILLGVASISAIFGVAIRYDGGNIAIPNFTGIKPSGDYSIEMLAKFSHATWSYLFKIADGSNIGPQIILNYNGITSVPGSVFFRENTNVSTGGFIVDGLELNDNVFRHYVFCRRGGALEVWVNGSLKGVFNKASIESISGEPSGILFSGSKDDTPDTVVDAFAYYNHALSADRINSHFLRSAYYYQLAGTAKLDTGIAASLVVASSWDGHRYENSAVPLVDGSFAILVHYGDYAVTVYGPSGYQPITHGPVAAVDI